MAQRESAIAIEAANRPDNVTRSLRTVKGARRLRRWLPVAVIVIAVMVANAPYLLHVFDPNPLTTLSLLGSRVTRGSLPGQSYVDPNVGFTAQALGHRAALNMIHGGSPWWNPYEGVGTPLAGEMNSAALFPPSVLMGLARGTLFFHLVLELTAGISTFALLRILDISRVVATAGATAFALNGSFAWLFHSAGNPIALLPLTLIGVELAWGRVSDGRRFGWFFIGAGLAFSVYAGFPEVAFIDGLLVALWSTVRATTLRGSDLRTFVVEVGSGIGWGIVLAAPILVAFVDYLPHANIGPHGGGLAHLSLPSSTSSTVLMPYLFGPIFGWTATNPVGSLTQFWDNVGGYLTVALIFLASLGLLGRTHRRLRIALFVWAVACVSRTFGLGAAITLLNLIPGVKLTAFYRYAPASWELAVIVLAAFGLDDLVAQRVARRVLLIVAGALLLAVCGAGIGALHLVRYVAGAPHNHLWVFASITWGVSTVVVLLVIGSLRSVPGRVYVLAGLVMVDSIAMFAVPEFSAPRGSTVNMRPVAFLQSHLGEQRFFTLGPIQANYGSYFGISEVNVNDLPMPKLYSTYIATHLNRNVNPITFTGNVVGSPSGPSNADELASNIESYRQIGVKYVVAPTNPPLPPNLQAILFPAYKDPTVSIYELPGAESFYNAAGCTIRSSGLNDATTICGAPSLLNRLELSMPGWRAEVNGSAHKIRTSQRLTQSVAVQQGISNVRFSFRPPHIDLALDALIAALLSGGVALLVDYRRSVLGVVK